MSQNFGSPSSIDGTNGIDGAKGDTGLTGAIGPIGPKGDTGAIGPKGADGTTIIDQRTQQAIKVWTGTQAQYDAVVSKDVNTLYVIKP